MGFTSILVMYFLVVGALLPAPTLSRVCSDEERRDPGRRNCDDRRIVSNIQLSRVCSDEERRDPRRSCDDGPIFLQCNDNCKSMCGPGETVSKGYCRSGRICCKREIIRPTCPHGGSCGLGGFCLGDGIVCSRGHKVIPGVCGLSKSCVCCARWPPLADCFYQGKTYKDGATWTDKCNTHKCSSGLVTTSLRSDCCTFGGSSYLSGTQIQNSCAQLKCVNGKFQYKGIDEECPRCKAYLDPHIVTYDQRSSSYSYQGCGNYSLSQIGSTYQPTVAIYVTFATCGGSSSLTCVETVTIKNDEHTFITIIFESNELKVEINGNDYAVSSSSPSIVMNAAYPVLVWKSAANCVMIQGSSGFLVQFCGSSRANHVYVWASPAITKSLKGLCGTVNNNINDDFTTRGGIITSPWQRTPSDTFPISWLTSSTSNGQCDGQAKRKAQNKCDSNSSSLNKYKSQCRTTIMKGFSSAQPEELNTMIEDCVFDLCHVNDPDDWIKAVEDTAQVQSDIKADTLVPGCQDKCTAGGGFGYCKDTCGLGEELLGSCPGGNCFCCRRQILVGCGGRCSARGHEGYCSQSCKAEIQPTIRRDKLNPFETLSTCSRGCTCCTLKK